MQNQVLKVWQGRIGSSEWLPCVYKLEPGFVYKLESDFVCEQPAEVGAGTDGMRYNPRAWLNYTSWYVHKEVSPDQRSTSKQSAWLMTAWRINHVHRTFTAMSPTPEQPLWGAQPRGRLSPPQCSTSRCCHLKRADFRAPEIARHHPFSRCVTRGANSDESFLPRQEVIDLNNCLGIFTWHSNTVAVMITNVSLPHSKSIIGMSVSDNLYSNKIFTLSQFWIVANISCDSHFIIQRELSQAFGTFIDADCHWISPFSCLFYSLSLVTTYCFSVSRH